MRPKTARELIRLLFDSFDEASAPASFADPIRFPGYEEEFLIAAEESGESESVIFGNGEIGEDRSVVAVFEFGFLGGSMSRNAGSRLAAAMEAARERRVPFIAVTSSGGARMQEGMAALAQMPRTVAASTALAAAGIPRISILAHPTTGGVYASFASLADVVIAQAGATIGFAGPRVAEVVSGRPLPEGSHTAEAAFEAGLVDFVGGLDKIKAATGKLLRIFRRRQSGPSGIPEPKRDTPPFHQHVPPSRGNLDPWNEFRLARDLGRPSPRRYIESIFEDLFEIRGDRHGSDDEAVLAALGTLEATGVVVVAIDRKRPSASGFRKARRAIEIAGRLGLTLVTFVDTPGADPTPASEYSGLSDAIARCFEAILTVEVPVISIVTGEGGSGGALALACGDVVAIQEHAVFSVIAPEGAAQILYRDSSRTEEVSRVLRPTSFELVTLGLADVVLAEPELGAHTNPAEAIAAVAGFVRQALESVSANPRGRQNRYSQVGFVS